MGQTILQVGKECRKYSDKGENKSLRGSFWNTNILTIITGMHIV